MDKKKLKSLNESNKLKGGEGDKMTPKKIADKFDVDAKDVKKQIEYGTCVECEHTDDKEKAKTVLHNFFNREDTLSVGICNGCQLFMELELVNPEHEVHGKMHFNDSHKHESIFTSVKIQENKSVMLSTLAGSTLGVWISHGEGKFNLPMGEENYNIVGKYGYDSYPANPNGSDYNTAMMCDKTGRHLVMMPHIERSTFPWNWAHYPKDRNDEVSPWIEVFVNARLWIENK